VDFGSAYFAGDLPDDVGCPAAAEQQLPANRGVQRGEAVVEPPALRRTHRIRVGDRFVFEDVECDHQPVGGGSERLIVCEPEVAAEPHQAWAGHQQVLTVVCRRKVPRERRAG
jgi:hypothetical protein